MRRVWERVSQVFSGALERDPAERSAYLADACGSDYKIRAEVERLLAEHDRAGTFILESAFEGLGLKQSTFGAGEVLAGRFRIIRFIDKGGMGEVYEAEDLELHERIALKTIRPELAPGKHHIARFKHEIQLSRKITHPNVCRVFDVSTHHDSVNDCHTIFLTMELLKGENLAQRLARTGKLSPVEASPILKQIIAALDAAHQAGIIHRDFKTANVMLTEPKEGTATRAVITDFGLARSTAQGEPGSGGHTQLFGTPAYMAPEQLEGHEATAATDIYALGLVMYEMVTGRQPFAGDTPLVAGIKRLVEPAPSPRIHTPDLPANWEIAILRCLERHVQNRYVSVRDILEQLQRKPGRRRLRNRRRAAAVGLAVLMVTAGIGARVLYITGRKQLPPGRRGSSVAVLRFQNASGHNGAEWLATALPEALTTEISATDTLRAIPRDEVVSVRQDIAGPKFPALNDQFVSRVGELLHANYVVYGSYTESPTGDIRMTMRVVEPGHNSTAFVVTEAGTEREVAKLIAKAAHDIERRIAVQATRGADKPIRFSLPSNREGARLYAEGLESLRSYDFKLAVDQLSKAAALDHGFALTHAALASAWLSQGYAAKARDEAKEALALSASLSREDRLRVEAEYFETTGNWPESAQRYQRLWNFYPDDLEYGLHYAGVLRAGGKFEESKKVLAALRLMPSPLGDNPRIDLSEARLYGLLGDSVREYRLAEYAAIKAMGQGLQHCVGEARLLAARARLNLGDAERAAELFGEAEANYVAVGFPAGTAHALEGLGAALKQSGRMQEALAANNRSIEIYRELGDHSGVITVLRNTADVLRATQDFSGAERAMSEAVAVAREIGDTKLSMELLLKWAELLDLKGDRTGARQKRQEAVSIRKGLSVSRASE